MRKALQQNFSLALLMLAMLSASCLIGQQLWSLHLNQPQGQVKRAASELITREKMPAQRGIIMDRNEEILTNNINFAELVADRNHLRDVTAVVDGLAFNQVVNSPEWAEANDKQRQKIYRAKRSDLLRNAKSKLTPEEKARLRHEQGLTSPGEQNRLDYDPEICAYYYALHDQLVASIILPFLGRADTSDDETTQPQKLVRPTTQADIIEKIAQTQRVATNEKAKAEGQPARSLAMRIVLARGLTLEAADQIGEALSRARIRGVRLESQLRRSYTMPQLMSHVLGFVDRENRGALGAEKIFDAYLSGINGAREYRHNAQGQIVAHEDDRYLAPKHGLNLRLTIDTRIQSIVEEELERGLRRFNAPRGCIIVVEPKTGDIIAMASRPAFDLNTKEIITAKGRLPFDNKLGPNKSRISGDFNFACQARYEPGSTMKVVAATTALDQGIMSMNSEVSCAPFSVIPNSNLISDGRARYGPMNIMGVLKKSSNPGTVRIALQCKWERFNDYLKRFGLREKAPIALPSGGACLIADGRNLLNFSRISYGYSISVSPLHMAMVYATIANKGVRMQPRLIDKIITSDGSIFDECEPEVAAQVMKEGTARQLLDALSCVTESSGKYGKGTATAAAIPGFKIAGKTGTARKTIRVGKRTIYGEGLYFTSFAGILPADKPRYVIMTVIDEPRPKDTAIGGGTIAAPIFHDLALRLIDLLNLTPSDEAAYEKYRQGRKTSQPNS